MEQGLLEVKKAQRENKKKAVVSEMDFSHSINLEGLVECLLERRRQGIEMEC